MGGGPECVTIDGRRMKLPWSAMNWDTLLQVCKEAMAIHYLKIFTITADTIGYLVDDNSYIGPVISASCNSGDEFTIYECLADYNCLEQQHGYVICSSNSSGKTN